MRMGAGECDLDHDMSVGARWAGLSISITADLLTFSHTTLHRGLLRMMLYRQNIPEEKQSYTHENHFLYDCTKCEKQQKQSFIIYNLKKSE